MSVMMLLAILPKKIDICSSLFVMGQYFSINYFLVHFYEMKALGGSSTSFSVVIDIVAASEVDVPSRRRRSLYVAFLH